MLQRAPTLRRGPGRSGWGIATVFATVVLASGAAAPRIEDLGSRVFGATTHAATFGLDRAGVAKAYILQDGALAGDSAPARFVVVDVETARVERTLTIPGGEGGWAMTVASDGAVYAGVYRSGHVFRYEPGTEKLEDLGMTAPEQSFLYGFCAGEDGAIYGGTFPGAHVFRYSRAAGFKRVDAGAERKVSGALPTYVRAVAHDAKRGVIYAGYGPNARVARIDLATGRTREVLPAEFAGADFPYAARVVGDTLLVRLLSTNQAVALDVSGEVGAKATAIFPATGLSFSEADADGNVAFTNQARPSVFNVTTRTVREIGREAWPANSYATAWLALADQNQFPGNTAVGICNSGGRIWLAKTNLKTGKTRSVALAIDGAAQTMSSLVVGPDDKVYVSGYLTGGTGVFDPARPAEVLPTLRGVSQAEGMTELGGHLYFGGYPGALVYDYDLGQPWREGENPRMLFKLAARHQDRPYAMTHDGAHRVVIGTVPGYGELGGALTILDTRTGEHVFRSAAQLGIPDLSVLSCAVLDGVVYAGTSISGGIGAHPTQTRAKLLRYSLDDGGAETFELPADIPNQTAITAVAVGPDRKIWMMTEGWLVVFDPATRRFEHHANLFPQVRYEPKASRVVVHDAALLTARDGWVYGTIQGRVLFKLEPKTRALTVISASEGGSDLVEDSAGRLYFVRGISLYRHVP
ncbi:MAG: hypothetical protein KF715_18805 [Candidatus Didemnitutus sp.]|nr:hypothetical protein [Candidatus Didemnitutus sp.]